MAGAEIFEKARYLGGKIESIRAYRRDGRTLPVNNESFGFLLRLLEKEHHWPGIIKAVNTAAEPFRSDPERRILIIHRILMSLEAMIIDGWVEAKHNAALPLEDLRVVSKDIRANLDQQDLLQPASG
jgi:hypothetical protein